MAIYITSDLHLGHNQPFIYEARGFRDVNEMNITIIKNINEVVKTDDNLYILGDLILGNIEEGKKLLKQIPGKVHVILGNHDTDKKREFYESLGWDCQWGLMTKINKYSIFMSHWRTDTQNFDLKPLKREVLNFHGHSHQTSNWTKDNYCAYHVGMDSHNCYPVLFEDIINEIIKYREKAGVIV